MDEQLQRVDAKVASRLSISISPVERKPLWAAGANASDCGRSTVKRDVMDTMLKSSCVMKRAGMAGMAEAGIEHTHTL
jgi:hypothetical protein